MSRKTILIIAPALLGIPIIFWAALATRGEGEPAAVKPPKPAPFRKAPPAPAPSEEPLPVVSTEGDVRPSSIPVSPETAAIQERVRKMEERVRELESKRDLLAADNKDLEKQVAEKWAETSARSMAEWRVKAWESLLGLSGSQKQSLIELMTKWGKEDAGRPAGRDAWLSRETDLRAQFTVEQSARLHDSAAAQAQQQWKHMGLSLGGMVGASKDEQARLQQSLGDIAFPQNMLLPEAYGADWNGLMREAATRVRPILTVDQTARLDKFGYK